MAKALVAAVKLPHVKAWLVLGSVTIHSGNTASYLVGWEISYGHGTVAYSLDGRSVLVLVIRLQKWRRVSAYVRVRVAYGRFYHSVKHGNSGRLCKFETIYSLQTSLEISDAVKLLVAGMNLYRAIMNYVTGCKL